MSIGCLFHGLWTGTCCMRLRTGLKFTRAAKHVKLNETIMEVILSFSLESENVSCFDSDVILGAMGLTLLREGGVGNQFAWGADIEKVGHAHIAKKIFHCRSNNPLSC